METEENNIAEKQKLEDKEQHSSSKRPGCGAGWGPPRRHLMHWSSSTRGLSLSDSAGWEPPLRTHEAAV